MSILLHLELIGLPPTVNNMYRNARGYRYKTGETQVYQNYAIGKLREIWAGKPVYKGSVELSIRMYTDNKRRWDIDNRVKALQDCLSEAGVIQDDCQIDELHVKRIREQRIGTEIILSSLDDNYRATKIN